MAGLGEKLLLKTTDSDFDARIAKLKEQWSFADFVKANKKVAETVREIVEDVGLNGDRAVAGYTNKFDGVNFSPDDFRVGEDELMSAYEGLDKDLLISLGKSIENVKKYQTEICIANKVKSEGIKYNPIRRVGVCVPGASAPLPSTVIMTVVPALVAGVEEIAVVSPPRYNGSIHPVILGLCWELGVREVYRISGAQAVAAMGWGTESIPKVDMIVGPGNSYVQMAKREVFGLVKIDSFAGPSDVIIVANDQANAKWIAADMLSQAEHAPGAALLLTDSQRLGTDVSFELQKQVNELSRAEETEKCLVEHSAIIVARNINEVIDFANDFAAEHLEVQCGDVSDEVEQKIVNAGAIFVGGFTPVATGDYFAGPSHTLPTMCTSKFFSALTSNDFLKSSSLIKFSEQQLKTCADDIIRIAKTEGLDAHAKSVEKRLM